MKTEIAIAFVGPVGVDTRKFERAAAERFCAYGYGTETVRLSDLLREFSEKGYLKTKLVDTPKFTRFQTYMDAGDELRKLRTRLLAQAAVAKVATQREELPDGRRKPIPERAWLFSSVKHPDEVDLLRTVYKEGFFLVGLFATEAERKAALQTKYGMSEDEAKQLVERDHKGTFDHGQQTRKTFQLADVWVRSSEDLRRFVDLLFGHPFQVPTEDENGMMTAYVSALRSSDLSRQVGAAIVSRTGEVLATGHNEVPAPGGGQYGANGMRGRLQGARDFESGEDSNNVERLRIQRDVEQSIREKLAAKGVADDTRKTVEAVVSEALAESSIGDITEFGRAVHAEMSAIVAAARVGISLRGSTLYCTTFPCHTCAKHIVAAGIARVVFVEPYPKSKAGVLHGDALTLVGEDVVAVMAHLTQDIAEQRTRLEPFIGVGPRRYFDLFSMHLGTGSELKRKDRSTGRAVDYRETDRVPRVQMLATGYIFREGESVDRVQETLEKLSGSRNDGQGGDGNG